MRVRQADITINKSRLSSFITKMIELGILNFECKPSLMELLKGISSSHMMVLDPPITVTLYMVKPDDEADQILEALHKVAMPQTLTDYFVAHPCDN